MPQTRFVLQKALQIGLKPIVVVNKVDKAQLPPEQVYEMVFDLMCDRNATEDQLDFPVVYGSAKNGGWVPTSAIPPTISTIYSTRLWSESLHRATSTARRSCSSPRSTIANTLGASP
jgi:hypothetical protein